MRNLFIMAAFEKLAATEEDVAIAATRAQDPSTKRAFPALTPKERYKVMSSRRRASRPEVGPLSGMPREERKGRWAALIRPARANLMASKRERAREDFNRRRRLLGH